MSKMDALSEKWSALRKDVSEGIDTKGSVFSRIKSVIGVIAMLIYRLRKIALAVPVGYYALKIDS